MKSIRRAVATELLTSPMCWTCYLALFVLFGVPLLTPTSEAGLVDRFVLFLALVVIAALGLLVLNLILQLAGDAVGAARALCARTRGR